MPIEANVEAPACRRFTHAYHHPERLRPEREWVDWFVGFDRKSADEKGLEFKEGLWAEKLAILAIIATIAIIVVSIVWCVLGGNLQTVFTVMSFVLTLIAGRSFVVVHLRRSLTCLKLKLHWPRCIFRLLL